MKTIKLYLPLIISLAILAIIIFIVPFWWLKSVLIGILSSVWISKIIIFQLKFRHEKLKKRFPKLSWHIQRLHEIYIFKNVTNDQINELKKLEKRYFNYKKNQQNKSLPALTFIEWCNVNVLNKY